MRTTPLLTEAVLWVTNTGHVSCEDGTSGDVDLSDLAEYGGVFEPLRDPRLLPTSSRRPGGRHDRLAKSRRYRP